MSFILQKKRKKKSSLEEKAVDIEAKPEITFDDFAKLQFQVGEDYCLRSSEEIQKASLLPG